jgi:hypothetical protein
MAKEETWNIIFTAKIGSQNRIVVAPNVVELADLKEGDIISLKMFQVHRKENC